MKVTFYLADEPNISKVKKFDPDKDWHQMRRGQRWTLQTYLRLLNAGYPVSLSEKLPSEGIVVFNAKHKYQLMKSMNGQHRNLILVGVRGDKNQVNFSDFELLQNGKWANNKNRFFLPYWSQPVLIKRDFARENKVENIAFKGFDINLNGYYFSSEWKEWLQNNDLNWLHHSMPYAPSDEYGVSVAWNDYSNVDVILAVRPTNLIDSNRQYSSKPATKLYNSWLAGTPAILGQEYAFRELRRSELDYIELSEPQDAKEQILRLKNDPEFYSKMVKNGFERATDFSNDVILEKWIDFLYNKIPEQVKSKSYKSKKGLPMSFKVLVNYLDRKINRRPKK